MLLYTLFGALGGFHRACWGAYKDSPYEPYKFNKTLRSVSIAGLWGFTLYFIFPAFGVAPSSVSLAYVYLMSLGLDTITIEFYKIFFRIENQEKYLIPSTFHLGKKRASYTIKKIASLIVFVILVLLFYVFMSIDITPTLLLSFHVKNRYILGAALGLFAGLLEAIGGTWKDAPFEGFLKLKFFRSPICGMLWGTILIWKQTNLGVVFFSILGANRSGIELYKGFIKGLKSGKFKGETATFPDWVEKRKVFILPYIFTWVVFLTTFFVS